MDADKKAMIKTMVWIWVLLILGFWAIGVGQWLGAVTMAIWAAWLNEGIGKALEKELDRSD